MVSSTETRTVIPGPFYWALNVVADAWDDFRYPVNPDEPEGESKCLRDGEAGVYHQLCRWADNKTRECYCYQSVLCKRLGISHHTLKNRLLKLQGAMLISVERGRLDPQTGAPAPSKFTLLDIQTALRYGRRLSGKLTAEEAMSADIPGPVEKSATPTEDTSTPLADISTPLEVSATPLEEISTYKDYERLSKTEKTVCCARDDTDLSSSSSREEQNSTVDEGELPAALRGEQRRRFPRTGELAAWCRDKLGRAVFPANAPPEEIEPFEEALERLEGVARRCGQTALEVITTRLSLRPEVREELLTAKMPDRVLGRQLNYAVEDYSARAARLGDATAVRPPEPLARLPATAPPRRKADEKPEWMNDEQWEFYEKQRLKKESAASTARDCPVPG